jgi:protein arginine N-methyltransferase 1
MYTLRDYDAMFADPVRTRAYLDAIAATVRPDDVVVEIGTGVGYFAVAAARAGARHVYAIEIDRIADVARQVVRDNGVDAQVTVLHGDALTLTLPERGTVLLDDLRGVLPYFESRAPVVVDAWVRHLTPDARSINRYDDVFVAPIVAPPMDERDAAVGLTPYGIDRSSVAARLRDEWSRVRVGSDALLAPPVHLHRLVCDAAIAPNADTTVTCIIARDGVCDGVIVWFDAALAGGATIANAPSAPQALYGQAFFPLTRPLDVRTGDRLTLRWRAVLTGATYVYAWDTTHEPVAGGPATAFRQSTLADALPARDELARLRGADGAAATSPGAGPHP